MTTMSVDMTSLSARTHLDRLLVTVRDPRTREYLRVGYLVRTPDGEYEFSYFVSALERVGFRPLPGLASAVHEPSRSRELFPVFAERVVSSRRSDRPTSMQVLALPVDAAPFEVLARSHGQRVGDTIELLPAPHVVPGSSVTFAFLTHGVRHLEREEQLRIDSLTPGEGLQLVRERTNLTDPRALLVTDDDSARLGWVPGPLIDVIDALTDPQLTVVRANGPEVGFHFRLLVEVSGVAPLTGELFDGPDWETHRP